MSTALVRVHDERRWAYGRLLAMRRHLQGENAALRARLAELDSELIELHLRRKALRGAR